jgi:S-phase kinase-associated protein 1
MADQGPKTVNVTTSDDQKRAIPFAIAMMLGTIATLIDDDCFEESDEGLPLSNVSAAVLDKIIEYCRHHKDDPPLSEEQVEEKRREEITGWDADFVKVPQNELFELILAANFLDNKPLLDLTCKKVAFMIRGKTPEEIRTMFNIENDFTPAEEEQIRGENEWSNEKA